MIFRGLLSVPRSSRLVWSTINRSYCCSFEATGERREVDLTLAFSKSRRGADLTHSLFVPLALSLPSLTSRTGEPQRCSRRHSVPAQSPPAQPSCVPVLPLPARIAASHSAPSRCTGPPHVLIRRRLDSPTDPRRREGHRRQGAGQHAQDRGRSGRARRRCGALVAVGQDRG